MLAVSKGNAVNTNAALGGEALKRSCRSSTMQRTGGKTQLAAAGMELCCCWLLCGLLGDELISSVRSLIFQYYERDGRVG